MTNFQPVEGDQYSNNADIHLDQNDPEKITELLMGKKVTKVSDDRLVLSDGTVLLLFGNEGGCACSAGDYDLTELNGTDNVITDVSFDNNPGSDYAPGGGYYKIFVFAGNETINLATFEGSDGNGYYGTGYHILVRLPR